MSVSQKFLDYVLRTPILSAGSLISSATFVAHYLRRRDRQSKFGPQSELRGLTLSNSLRHRGLRSISNAHYALYLGWR